MIDPELSARLDTLEKKVDAAFAAADKVRKWIFWTGVITVILFVVPLIGLVFALPSFLNYYTTIGTMSGQLP